MFCSVIAARLTESPSSSGCNATAYFAYYLIWHFAYNIRGWPRSEQMRNTIRCSRKSPCAARCLMFSILFDCNWINWTRIVCCADDDNDESYLSLFAYEMSGRFYRFFPSVRLHASICFACATPIASPCHWAMKCCWNKIIQITLLVMLNRINIIQMSSRRRGPESKYAETHNLYSIWIGKEKKKSFIFIALTLNGKALFIENRMKKKKIFSENRSYGKIRNPC